jgi:hypothetical protein
MWNASRFCVSSLRRGHANLLCIVPILVYVPPKRVRGRTLPPAVYIPAAVGLLPPAAKAASVNVRRGATSASASVRPSQKPRQESSWHTGHRRLYCYLAWWPIADLEKGLLAPLMAHQRSLAVGAATKNKIINLLFEPRAKAIDRSCQDSNLESSDP